MTEDEEGRNQQPNGERTGVVALWDLCAEEEARTETRRKMGITKEKNGNKINKGVTGEHVQGRGHRS